MVVASCKKSGCLESAGARVTTSRTAGTIREIRLYDNIHLLLKQDTLESINIEAGKNLEPFIETVLDKGVLTIRNKIDCSWLRDPSESTHVSVSVVQLEKLHYEGSGNVRSANTLKSKSISFYSELGAGNIEVSLQAEQTLSYIMDENADFIFHGSSNIMWSYTNSRGTLDCSDFVVKKMIIEYGGVKDATIHVTEELDAILYHKGNLYYKGDPFVRRSVQHSTGKLLRR